jgi:hypothetical protein
MAAAKNFLRAYGFGGGTLELSGLVVVVRSAEGSPTKGLTVTIFSKVFVLEVQEH